MYPFCHFSPQHSPLASRIVRLLVARVFTGGRFKAVVSGVAMAGLGYGSFYANRYAQSYVKERGQERLRERVAQARGERTEKEANRVEIGFDPMRSRK